MKVEERVEEIFILMKIAKMSLTEINTLTDQEREMLALKFYHQAKLEDEIIKESSRPCEK